MKIARKTMKVEVPSMAMGDIAFNLLVFFVILARAQDDSALQWTPAKTDRVESAGQSKVSIVLDKDEKLYVNGQPVGQSQLEGMVEKLLEGLPAGQRTVLLKIHNDAQANRFEPILEAVSKSGGELVHILEEQRPGTK